MRQSEYGVQPDQKAGKKAQKDIVTKAKNDHSKLIFEYIEQKIQGID